MKFILVLSLLSLPIFSTYAGGDNATLVIHFRKREMGKFDNQTKKVVFDDLVKVNITRDQYERITTEKLQLKCGSLAMKGLFAGITEDGLISAAIMDGAASPRCDLVFAACIVREFDDLFKAFEGTRPRSGVIDERYIRDQIPKTHLSVTVSTSATFQGDKDRYEAAPFVKIFNPEEAPKPTGTNSIYCLGLDPAASKPVKL